MKISYKKLWKLLIDREMMKKELAEQAGISTASIAKLGKNENVNTEILLMYRILWKLFQIKSKGLVFHVREDY